MNQDRLRVLLMVWICTGLACMAAAQDGRQVTGWMGVELRNLDVDLADELGLDSTNGVLVVRVLSESPAEQAGVKDRDVIRMMDDEMINDYQELRVKIRMTRPGQLMRLLVIRQQKPLELQIRLGTRPPPRPPPPAVPN